MKVIESALLNSVRLEIATDGKNIHLLDKGGLLSLTNGLSEQFCRDIVTLLDLLDTNLENYEFLGYHTDLTICRFKPTDESFRLVHLEDPRVYEPFKRDMFYRFG